MTGVAGEFVNATFFVLWGCVVRPGFCKLLYCVGGFESFQNHQYSISTTP
jgi:hypothetical protein